MPAFNIFAIEQLNRCAPNRIFGPDQQRSTNSRKIVSNTVGINHGALKLIAANFNLKIYVPVTWLPLRGNRKAVFAIAQFNFSYGARTPKSIYKMTN